jgi:hypothetical protein
MDHAAEFRGADNVIHPNGGCFFRWHSKVRRQMFPRRMWAFFVIMAAPHPANVIQMFFGDDDKLVQTLEFQRLNESAPHEPADSATVACSVSQWHRWISAPHRTEH